MSSPRRHRPKKTPEPTGDTNSPSLRPKLANGEDKSTHTETQTMHSTDSGSDSGPLSDLIGPLPPSASKSSQTVSTKGRGAFRTNNQSNIDAHFASGYDPTLDLHLDDDDDDGNQGPSAKTPSVRPVPGLTTSTTDDIDDDWDMALEALRDRVRWRQQGADRLREAGFDDSVVDRFVNNRAFVGLQEGSGWHDRDVADVRWSKKGESREWDRGKVINEDGHVDIKAPW